MLASTVSIAALLFGAQVGPAAAPTPTPDTPPVSAPATDKPAPVVATQQKVVIEACDGAHTVTKKNPGMLKCRRWRVAWHEGGTAWGFTVADSYEAVIAERERQLGFARRYARFFEVALDERYLDPGPPICDSCESQGAVGRWGEGQKFGDSEARRALATAETELEALDAALIEHAPFLADAARLSRTSDPAKLSKHAKEYGKQLRQGMLDLAKGRLSLDNAEVFRSESKAEEVSRMARSRVESLAASAKKVSDTVGDMVGKAHGGRYLEDGKADGPFLDVAFEGSKVTATYAVGDAQATWFEGTVALDGSISGRSLLAPESGELTCQAHTVDCGYEYVDSVLRFNLKDPQGKDAKQVAELWFRRSKWVMAKPFLR